MSKSTLLALVIGFSSLTVTSVHAQSCAPRKALTENLLKKYNERPVSIALTNNNKIITIYKSPDGNTWTATITGTDGLSCFLGSGSNWQSVPVVKGSKS